MIELCCEYLSVPCIWLHVIIMPHTSVRINLNYIICLNVKEILAWSRCHSWSLSDSNVIRTHNHLVYKQRLNHLAKTGQINELCFEFRHLVEFVNKILKWHSVNFLQDIKNGVSNTYFVKK